MTVISTGKTRLRAFESCLRDVKYLDGTSNGRNQPRFTTHEEAVRLMEAKAEQNKNNKFNLDC